MTSLDAFAFVMGIPVYRDPYAAAYYDDGSPRLYTLCRATSPPCVLVHPDRWDEFCDAFCRKEKR